MIYLDHAASSQPKPDFICKYVAKHLAIIQPAPHRSFSDENTLEIFRSNLLKFLDAPVESDLVFTKNATEAANLFLYGFNKKNKSNDDKTDKEKTCFFSLKTNNKLSYSIDIYDITGRIIVSEKNLVSGMQNQVELPAKGIYLYKLSTENGKIETGKICLY